MGLLDGRKGSFLSFLSYTLLLFVVFQSHFLVDYQGGGALNVISDMICRSLNYMFSCLQAENSWRRGFIIIFYFFRTRHERSTAEEEAGGEGSGWCTRSLHSRHSRREGAREPVGSERESGWSDEVRAGRAMEPRRRCVTESPQTGNS